MNDDGRIQYRSLTIHDVSRSEFDPESLGVLSGPPYISTYLGSTKLSSISPLMSPGRLAGSTNCPSKSSPFYPLKASSTKLGKLSPVIGFEVPEWKKILLHIALCLVSYPTLLGVVFIAGNRSIFWTRFIVGVACGFIGLSLGYSLLTFAKSHLEAATWATVIHQSHFDGSPGVRLRDLAATTEDPTSAWTALRLLWIRMKHPATSQRPRQDSDRRPWPLFIAFFLLLVVVAGTLPFILGRLINIDPNLIHQSERYEEISIKGDNSDTDIAQASKLAHIFNINNLTWTMAPFSTHGGLPPVVSFSWKNDTIYLAETTASQLLPNGSGFGTFDTETTDPSSKLRPPVIDDRGAEEVLPGSILRLPKWGIRIRCIKLPDAVVNLVALGNNSRDYIFTPQPSNATFDVTKVVVPGDEIPAELNTSEIALGAAFYHNGVTHSFFSLPVSTGQDGKGWVSIEEVLVRLNTTYAPSGTFAFKSDQSLPDAQGNPTWLGYDAAICVELFEPWIVEQGNVVLSQDTPELQERLVGLPLSVTNPDAHQTLNSSKLYDVYVDAHQNSVNQIIKDNGRDLSYVPSPTVVSFSGGQGFYGYRELSAPDFAQARGLADAGNLLPYFVGTGEILTRRYQDLVSSSTSVNQIYMGIYIGLILLLGVLAGCFVPKLPLNVPHRGFDVYSWVAAFHADELIENGGTPENRIWIEKNMDLHEIVQQTGDIKFRLTT